MGLASFLSEENLSLHREHLSALRLKKQMVASSERQRIERQIRAHELFFSSFRKERVRCDRVRKGYGSENRFCYLLKEYAESALGGFLYIYPMCGYPFVGFGGKEQHLRRAVLAIDLFEHAYFLDYGFDVSSYIEAALSHLDLGKLNTTLADREKTPNLP